MGKTPSGLTRPNRASSFSTQKLTGDDGFPDAIRRVSDTHKFLAQVVGHISVGIYKQSYRMVQTKLHQLFNLHAQDTIR